MVARDENGHCSSRKPVSPQLLFLDRSDDGSLDSRPSMNHRQLGLGKKRSFFVFKYLIRHVE